MRLRSSSTGRHGITLLEILASTAIFLMSLVAISGLMSSATDQAIEVNFLTRGTRLCQSKLNEYIAGVQPCNTSGSGTFDEEPDWSWSADCASDTTAINLYKVTVTVSRETSIGKIEVVLSQYIFDPAQKGQLPANSSSSSTSGSSTTTTSSTGSSTNGSTSGGSNTGGGNTSGGNTGGGGNNTGGGGNR